MDPTWVSEVLGGHYRVWSFVEYGTFRPFACAQRETLSDTLSSAFIFEGLDRLRHAQDIVIYMMELEEQLPGLGGQDAKQRWLDDPRYQPSRRLIEQLMYETRDWGELCVAVNLILDPILSEVALFQLIRRLGPFNGDFVTPFIVSTAERDRRWSRAWTEALVRMVTAGEVSAAKENLNVLQEWVDKWTPITLEAALALEGLYEVVPDKGVSFADTLSEARSHHDAILSGLGLQPGGMA
jgi:methane monooxygenase component A beta chain/propane monooxygenase small subunit